MDFRDKRRIRTVLDELRVTQGGPVASPPQNVRKWPSVAIWAQAVLFQAITDRSINQSLGHQAYRVVMDHFDKQIISHDLSQFITLIYGVTS